MKRWKVALPVLTLLFATLLFCLPVRSKAVTSGDFTYKLVDGKATITNYSASGPAVVNIPTQLDGYPVTAIGKNAFQDLTNITSVTIPGCVETIGEYSFRNCTNLTSVNIGNGVKSVGSYAFGECTGLTAITIPDSVTTIESAAFRRCCALTKVTLPKYLTKIESNTFSYCDNLKEMKIPNGVTAIGSSAFAGCISLSGITIPAAVEKINTGAFKGCSAMKELNFEENGKLNFLGYSAFENCSSLTSVVVPDTVAFMGEASFGGCVSLQKITVPYVGKVREPVDDYCYTFGFIFGSEELPGTTLVYQSHFYMETQDFDVGFYYIPTSLTEVTVTGGKIVRHAFLNYTHLKKLTVGKDVTAVYSIATAECTGLEEVHISDLSTWCNIDFLYAENALTGVADLYFDGQLLTDLVVPKGVTVIKANAFYNYKNLRSVTLPDETVRIENNAFRGCSGLTSVKFGKSVREIGSQAFDGCESLGDFTFPEALEDIGDLAFRYCKGLTKLYFPDKLTTIGGGAFHGCDGVKEVSVGPGITAIGNAAFFNCNSIGDVYIRDANAWAKVDFATPKSNPSYLADSAHILDKNGQLVTHLELDKSVTAVSGTAFTNCNDLVSISIHEGITDIGKEAFFGCDNLRRLDITDLSAWCRINFENSLANPLSSADDGLYLNGELVRDITIPSDVTEIGAYAFYGYLYCGTVTFGEGVTHIGAGAFTYCYNLNKVYIPSTLRWVGKDAFYYDRYMDVYVSDLTAWCGIAFENGASNPLYFSSNLYVNGKPATDLVIPSDVASIGNGAFYGADNIVTVTVPGNLTAIGYSAFEDCNKLTSVTVSGAVSDIMPYAFSGCNNLREVTIDALFNLNEGVFYNCVGLQSVTLPLGLDYIGCAAFENCTALPTITLPDSVRTIDENAFAGCSKLYSIKLGDWLRTVNSYAFDGCTSLALVYYEGTAPQWAAIPFSVTGNDALFNAQIYPNWTEDIPEEALPKKNGWYREAGGLRYYEDSVAVTSAWRDDGGNWRWLDENGYAVFNQWVTDPNYGYTYYMGADGYRVKGEVEIDGEIYYFDKYGEYIPSYTVTFLDYDGSVISSKKYLKGDTVTPPEAPVRPDDDTYTYTFKGWDKYINAVYSDATYTARYTQTKKSASTQKNGWYQENGSWYYYEKGVRVTNAWRKDSVGWCYLDNNGRMRTNAWVRDSVGWCYVGGNGYIVYNRWVKDSNGWCYIDGTGYMVYNQWVQDSVGWCYVGPLGYMLTNQWVRDSKGWCYVGSNGYAVTNCWKQDSSGKWCHLNYEGSMDYDMWIPDANGWCYVGSDGYMVTNDWTQDSKGWCYMGADGYCLRDTSCVIDGVTYYFDSIGNCTNR